MRLFWTFIAFQHYLYLYVIQVEIEFTLIKLKGNMFLF
jgi:hypothetical protein